MSNRKGDAPEEASADKNGREPLHASAEQPQAPAGGVAIAMRGVSVRAAGHMILSDIDLNIEPGSQVAIVGPSGAGKSSMVGLLLGWHRPASGQVLIDGVSLDRPGLERLRRDTAWVDPAVRLWNRSFVDNLRYRAPVKTPVPVDGVIAQADLRQVLERLQAAARLEPQGLPDLALSPALNSNGQEALVEAHELTFHYGDRARAVLRECSLRVCPGERVLLDGPSGGGKSTLAALLAGLRAPESGLLLLRGLDQQTLGLEGWRQQVVVVPQFHENHVLTETFAFNLLMGRAWPPGPEDLAEAEAVCQALGLGDVLERMPAGLLQMVGETGWQLSHGERSRLYIARALLQKAELIILDESFAALDPENL
jgi:ABC-type bacteriocin/lantibiotic exporter with double-glycine peptidase domain